MFEIHFKNGQVLTYILPEYKETYQDQKAEDIQYFTADEEEIIKNSNIDFIRVNNTCYFKKK